MKKILIALALLAVQNGIYAQSLTINNNISGCKVHYDMEAVAPGSIYAAPCSILGYDGLLNYGPSSVIYPSPAAFTPGFYDALGNTIPTSTISRLQKFEWTDVRFQFDCIESCGPTDDGGSMGEVGSSDCLTETQIWYGPVGSCQYGPSYWLSSGLGSNVTINFNP